MKKSVQMPKFKNESEEADWWSSREGRDYVKLRSADAKSKGTKPTGSRLVPQIATRKDIGYQTLIKMLVHEGLQREAERI